jgi:Flp pilus assembly protein TadD
MMKNLLIATIAIAALALTGCVNKSYDDKTFNEFAYGEETPGVKLTSEQHEQVGDGYVRRNKPEMALMHFNKAIEVDKTNLDARVKRGDLLVSQGLDEQALAEFNRVLEVDPDHAIANEAAGCVYFRAGLFTEAQAHLNKAVALNPLLWKAHNFLGIIHDRAGEYDEAATEFSAALELHQGNGVDEIYNNLGVVQIARKDYGEAVETFRLALKSGGVSARTYNNLGLALARLGRLDEALESFKYAGGEAKANNNLGYVLLTENRPAQAVPYFEAAIELSPAVPPRTLCFVRLSPTRSRTPASLRHLPRPQARLPLPPTWSRRRWRSRVPGMKSYPSRRPTACTSAPGVTTRAPSPTAKRCASRVSRPGSTRSTWARKASGTGSWSAGSPPLKRPRPSGPTCWPC